MDAHLRDKTAVKLLLMEASPGRLAAHFGAAAVSLPMPEWATAADLISREKIDAVFYDFSASGEQQTDFLGQILRVHPQLPIVAVLAQRDFDQSLTAFRRGAMDVLVMPLDDTAVEQVMVRVQDQIAHQARASSVHQATERALGDLVLLKAIGETASSEDDFQLLLDRVVASIQMALGVEIVSLMLANDDQILELRAARGLPEDAFMMQIKPGQGISGHVFEQGEPVLIEDLANDGRFRSLSASGRYRSGSLLSVPIRYQDRVVGVLNVNNKQDGQPFTGAEQDLLQTISQQAALAIENHKLVSRLRQKSQELESTHADLVRLHDDRTRFVCNLSHELKTPLTSVLGFSDLLVNFYDQVEQERVAEYLEGIHREALHLEKLLTAMLRLFSIDSGSENWQWQPLDLNAAVEDVLRIHELAIVDKVLDVSVKMDAQLRPIWGDPDKLALLLDALIDNAVKFNQAGGALRVWAENRWLKDRGMVFLTICNEGETVPLEAEKEIFQQYSQLGDLDAGKPCGVGIGLATCRAILRQMNGQIFLEPVVGEGTCFGVLLPMSSGDEG